MEKINITDSSVIEDIRGVMPVATSEKNGLMSTTDKGNFAKTGSASNLLIWQSGEGSGYSASFFISVSESATTRQNLYFVSINKNTGKEPSVFIKCLSGTYLVKVKYMYNNASGKVYVFLERSNYTIITGALLMSGYGVSDKPLLLSLYTGDLTNALEATIED